MEAINNKLAGITTFMTGIENELKFFLNWWEEFIEASKGKRPILVRRRKGRQLSKEHRSFS